MPTTSSNSIRISHHAKTGKQSRVRVQFDALTKQLAVQRERLAAWHDVIPKMQARSNAELMPLSRQYDARCREMIFLLDTASVNKRINKKEREKLSDLICTMSVSLLMDGSDDELAAIFQKHSWSGIEDLKDDPEFVAFGELMDQLVAGELSFDGPDEGVQPSRPKGKAKKKVSHKEAAQEARQAAEEQRLQQSVREIFRKLTSSLHPDRELDPREHERKTALMQRVNVAYTNNDLLGLLELQFEIEQIDQAGLETLPEARIKQYNKLLDRQVNQVRRDIAELERWLIFEWGIETRGRVTPMLLETTLSADIAEAKERLAEIEHDLHEFQDIGRLKACLKSYRIQDMPSMFDDGY